jgi:hypothetical protein
MEHFLVMCFNQQVLWSETIQCLFQTVTIISQNIVIQQYVFRLQVVPRYLRKLPKKLKTQEALEANTDLLAWLIRASGEGHLEAEAPDHSKG